jgi:hypothetical protein
VVRAEQFTFPGTGVGAIADGGGGTPPMYGTPRVISFAVAGLTGNVGRVAVDVTLTHTWVGDIDMVLAAPGGAPSMVVVSRIGVTTAGGFGDSSNYGGTYGFTDTASGTNIWTVATNAGCPSNCAVTPGGYRTTAAGGTGQTNPPPVTSLGTTFNGLTAAQANGTWTLTIRDGASLDTGSVTAANLSISGPTAADGVVNGKITDNGGAPVAGAVVNLGGTQNRKTITDANGNYQFDNVETTGFYTVTPSRANYLFSPASRSFSQLGNHTEAAFTGSSTGDSANPFDTSEYFVRQQYLDILGREPDEGGFNYWSDQIDACGSDAECTRSRRISVAAAFFIEQEFQQTGSFIYDSYKGALGRRPGFAEYSSDRRQVVGGANLDAEKAAFADSFVQRAEFAQRYQSTTTAESFVAALLQNVSQSSGVDLNSQRDTLIARYNTGANQTESRSLVVRDIAENAAFRQAEYSAAFVLTEYFNYLRRDPESAGYDFWLNVLNNGEPGNYRGMVCAFITSTEYQRRFSGVVSHGNGECAQ